MIFEGKDVEVFEHDGVVLFNPRHVGECLGMAERTVREHVTVMNDKKKIKLKNSDGILKDIRKLSNAGEFFVTESGVLELCAKCKSKSKEYIFTLLKELGIENYLLYNEKNLNF